MNNVQLQLLINTKTGLYLQSPGYIYSYLKEEIESNQDSDKEIS
jgi:hypothetical protein